MLTHIKRNSLLGLFLALFCTHSVAAPDAWQLNMHKGVTPLSKEIYQLHMVAMWVCIAIGVVVFGVMIYSLIAHRRSRGVVPATFHDNTRLEIVWSVIPFLILIGLAVPATKVLMQMDDSSDAAVTVKIVGYQWRWEYQYMDEGLQYFSTLATPFAEIHNQAKKGEWYLLEVDKPLVLPVHQKIRFLVTSNDVVHSWWVPELGVKRDAIPGFVHEAWARIDKEGTYRGQCAELCGINHGFMPIVVKAVDQATYDSWVLSQKQMQNPENTSKAQDNMTLETLMTLGKEKYNTLCSACHKADGTGMPPMYPALKGSSIAVGYPISRHIEVILQGVPNSAMQAYGTQLTDTEIAAIATYERNAWENNTNDLVQPADVAKVRQDNKQQPTVVQKARPGGLE